MIDFNSNQLKNLEQLLASNIVVKIQYNIFKINDTPYKLKVTHNEDFKDNKNWWFLENVNIFHLGTHIIELASKCLNAKGLEPELRDENQFDGILYVIDEFLKERDRNTTIVFRLTNGYSAKRDIMEYEEFETIDDLLCLFEVDKTFIISIIGEERFESGYLEPLLFQLIRYLNKTSSTNKEV